MKAFRGWRSSSARRNHRRLREEKNNLRKTSGARYPRFCRIRGSAVDRSSWQSWSNSFATAGKHGVNRLGQQGGETKNPPCQSARRVSRKLYQLFSSFLRGASCPKSPRVAATAASSVMPKSACEVNRRLREIAGLSRQDLPLLSCTHCSTCRARLLRRATARSLSGRSTLRPSLAVKRNPISLYGNRFR